MPASFAEPPAAPWPGDVTTLHLDELAELDRIAPEALTRGLPARLVGEVDTLLAADFDGHPWSQLLAAAACHDAYRGDPRATHLVELAWDTFETVGRHGGPRGRGERARQHRTRSG